MKKIFFLVTFCVAYLISFTQSTVPIRGDTIRVYKQGGKAVLKTDSVAMVTGNVTVGRSLAAINYSASVDLRDSTGAIILNRMWDKANILSPVDGMLIYQESNDKFYRRENGAWVEFGSGGGTGSNLSWNTGTHAVDIDGGGTSAVIPYATGVGDGLMSTANQTFAGDKNFGGNVTLQRFNVGWQFVVTSAGTETLTSTSLHATSFTGTNTHTLVLPDATTLRLGQRYRVRNNSTGAITINRNGGSNLLTLSASTAAYLICTDISGAAGTWEYEVSSPTGGGGAGLVDGDYGDITVGGSGTTMTYDFRRFMAIATVVATDADIAAVAGTVYSLPAATLTQNRNIDMTNVNVNGDYIEFDNQEAGFTWTFTGQTVYDAMENPVTTLFGQLRYIIRRSNGKLKIIN